MTQSIQENTRKIVFTLGFYSAVLTALIPLASFFVVKPPISGVFCMDNCIVYPYTNILSQFPKDYIWMYFMIPLMIVYIIWTVSIHHAAPVERKIFSQTGLTFASISAAVLLIDYFLQLAVIQSSLLNGESEGIALLTQYNPHGVFIALEELGYLIMSVSFLFMGLALGKADRLSNAVRWIFWLGFVLSISTFFTVYYRYGLYREYIFEVFVILITWSVLIVNGILSSLIFRPGSKGLV